MRTPTFHRRREAGTIDQAMTPMIDVVFLLLIFFVCASVGQVSETLLPTELAGGGVEAELPAETPRPLGEVWIKLTREGGQTIATVNETPQADFDALEKLLIGLRTAEAASEMPAILDAADAVPLGDVIRVYDRCLAAGFASIHFAVGSDD